MCFSVHHHYRERENMIVTTAASIPCKCVHAHAPRHSEERKKDLVNMIYMAL